MERTKMLLTKLLTWKIAIGIGLAGIALAKALGYEPCWMRWLEVLLAFLAPFI